MVMLGNIPCGPEHPPVLVAELGLNYATGHPREFLSNVVKMIRLAKMSGAQLVKLQKRTPRVCVPKDQWKKPRTTPWGLVDYITYKEDIELDAVAYDTISTVCKEEGIEWFASIWDLPSLEFIQRYDPPCYKIGSASLTDWPLVKEVVDIGKPVIMSTGMSTEEEIFRAVMHVSRAWDRLVLCHSTSIYPCPKENLNLRMIATLKETWPKLVIGYSGHEIGVAPTPSAVALGAAYIERHFTLDRRGWGTDQAASIEHWQFKEMADRIMETWVSLGDGVKQVYPEEMEKKVTLRAVDDERQKNQEGNEEAVRCQEG